VERWRRTGASTTGPGSCRALRGDPGTAGAGSSQPGGLSSGTTMRSSCGRRGLAAGKSTAAELGAGIVLEDEAGQSMTPPRARPGAGSVRPRLCGCEVGAPGGCRWRAWSASSRADGPASSVRSASIGDARTSRRASAGGTSEPWPSALASSSGAHRADLGQRPPPPDRNPTEDIWALVKRDLGNLAAADLCEITRAVKRRLKGSSTVPTSSTAASLPPA
jgi:hypothetical protein